MRLWTGSGMPRDDPGLEAGKTKAFQKKIQSIPRKFIVVSVQVKSHDLKEKWVKMSAETRCLIRNESPVSLCLNHGVL